MATPNRYQPFWVSLPDGCDQRERVGLAASWARRAPSREALLVLDAVGAQQNWAFEPVRWMDAISTRSRNRPSYTVARRVVTFRPRHATLELAERYALDGELCVIGSYAGPVNPVGFWVDRTGAESLVSDADDSHEKFSLDDEAASAIDLIL